MAVSNKPRKKRHVKRYMSPFAVKTNELEHLKQDFQRFSLTCEITLPAGTCSADDVYCMRDWFNLVKIALLFPKERTWLQDTIDVVIERYNLDVEPTPEAVYAEAVKAGESVRQLGVRGLERGNFVCKSDELNAIRDFALFAGPIIQLSLDLCPRRTMKEYLAMKELVHGKEAQGKTTVDLATLERTINKY